MSGNPAREGRDALLAALEGQQKTLNALAHKMAVQDVVLDYVAGLAGVGQQVTAIRKRADLDNPAQPVDNPPSQPATESTEQAATPEAYDNVANPGMTPGSVQDVAADTTDVALAPGESLPTAPFNNLVDVQAPVAGTEGPLPLDQTRIETDVRVDQAAASPASNPAVAYPWTLASKGGEQGSSGRTMASLRLARLQIEAGVAQGDDLAVAAQIERSAISDDQIAQTIATLDGVKKAATLRATRPANLVPRAASAQRAVPSMAADGPIQASASVVPVGANDTMDADLFD